MSRQTTLQDVEQILKLKGEGRAHVEIVKATGLPGNTITRVFDGWRPSGRKPVKIFKAAESGFVRKGGR